MQSRGRIVVQQDPPNGPYEVICKLNTGTPDADLIVAAPDLLVACKAAEQLCAIFEENLLSATRATIRAAIDKAEGR